MHCPAVDIQNLTFTYSGDQPNLISVSSWQVPRGSKIFLEGKSGSGKSTFLKLLSGLELGSGVINVGGTNLTTLPTRKRDRFRAKNIGVVFQQFNLIPYLSAIDNVLLAASLAGNKSASLLEAVRSLFKRVGLTETEWLKTERHLSVGQQQRVAIVRALINSPGLLLFDEPTSALDEENTQLFINLLFDLLEESSAALIYVSHDQQHASRFDQVLPISAFQKNEPLLNGGP